MLSVLEKIEARIQQHPDKLLFVFLDVKGNIKESYTYGDFEQKTKNIAGHIQRHSALLYGDRVLLAYPPGIEMIWAFFACVKLGLLPVPVYPPTGQGFEASVQKMNFIAKDCGAKAVLTDRSSYWSYKINLSRNKTGVSALHWIISDDADSTLSLVLPPTPQEVLFLQYTSGSTSDPKGVIVTHANIIQNGDNVVDHLPIGISWLPQYHDMGLIGYYLFFALKGGTTYGFSPADFVQRPSLWLEAITKFGGTASSAPNFAYEYCLLPGKIPEHTLATLDLSSVRFLMTAAEPIKTDVYSSFLKKFMPHGLKPECFFGAYGLAEYTLAVTNYGRKFLTLDAELLKQKQVRICTADDPNSSVVKLMSCGRALNNTFIKIVDADAGNKEVADGVIGEIWLNGPSKCKGYWNQPELTQEVFEAKLKDGNGEDKWLRTGDLGFLHEGELYVCGRIKDLIIIRGLNYYPQDIEAVVEKDPLIRAGCLAAFSVENSGNELLIIVAGLKSSSKIPDAWTIRAKISQHLGLTISEIVFVKAKTVSKTSSGKIKRHEIKQKYLNSELDPIAHVIFDPAENQNEITGEDDLPEKNRSHGIHDYHSLFRKYKLSGSESHRLGDAGLDSIRLAEFGHDLKKLLEQKGFDDLSNEVDLKLLQKIAVSELLEILKELNAASYFVRFKFRQAFSIIHAEYEKSETRLIAKDASSLNVKEEHAPALSPDHTEGGIFLTGGSGFFGPFLISSLLEQNTTDIYVLVRSASEEEGKNRLRKAFHSIHPSAEMLVSFEARVKPVCGDLSKPRLGLSNKDRDFLSHHIRCIYHNGASVNYLMDYETMRMANVNGTKEVIDLALRFRYKIVNHISTTFIFGWSVKEVLYEQDCNSKMESLDFGYSQSKWASEQLILKAMEQGLQARIFRPALISPSIKGRGYNFDISIRLLSFMLKYEIGTDASNQVSFTPADIAANNIVAISNLDNSIGKIFHVTRDAYSSMQDITERLGILAGKSFKNFALKAFVPEVVSRCEKHDLLFPLLNFLVKSVDNISAMEFKRYDNSNYRTFRQLSSWGKEDPALEDVVKGIFLFMKNNSEIADSLMLESVPAFT